MRLHTAIALSAIVALSAACKKKNKDDIDTDTDADTDADVAEITWDGVGAWLITVLGDQASSNEPNSTCEENFNALQCPAGRSFDDPDWSESSSDRFPPSGFVAYITAGLGGQYFLNWNGDFYPGTRSEIVPASAGAAGTVAYAFAWERLNEDKRGQTNSKGYRWEATRTRRTTTNISFDVDLGAGTATGAYATAFEGTAERVETDVWDPDQVRTPRSRYYYGSDSGYYEYGGDPLYQGGIQNGITNSFSSNSGSIAGSFNSSMSAGLEPTIGSSSNDYRNDATEAECNAAECRWKRTFSQTESTPITGGYIGPDDDSSLLDEYGRLSLPGGYGYSPAR